MLPNLCPALSIHMCTCLSYKRHWPGPAMVQSNMKLAVLCSIWLVYGAAVVVAVEQENYLIYDVQAPSLPERELLLRLSQNERFDFMHLPRNLATPARVLIARNDKADFEQLLEHYKLRYNYVPDTNTDVENEVEFEDFARAAKLANDTLISFRKFHSYKTINDYLDVLAKVYAERVTVAVAGVSYEGRPLKTLTISNGDKLAQKNVIIVDAGIHAREWIAPAAALYIIHELVENFEKNADLLARYNWVILPLVNPDGYEYTQTKARMWRKTRRPNKYACIGTDGNRNFDFHWGEIGSSQNCYSETFRGEAAFSEPETQTVRKLMWQHKNTAKFYLSLHAYGRYLLYPWGYTSTLPSNWRDLQEVAQAGAAAIKASTGSSYTVGSSTNVLYAAAGGSDDYALGSVGIPISITMELPAGGSGFNPRPAQILPFVKETWTGIRAMAEKVNEKY